MSKPKILWAVTSGEYSDFCVQAVFERQEDAERAKDAGLGDDVTEMAYFTAGEQPERFTLHRATTQLNRNHPEYDRPSRVHSRTVWWTGQDHPAPKRPELISNELPGERVFISAEGGDADGVLKAVHDRIARVKAEWAGLT